MNGPYVWEPPVYWYADTQNGGAFGFCAEQGDETVPPEESLRKWLPAADLWPIDATWYYHVGLGVFRNLISYSPAISKRYGAAADLSDYAAKAQLLNYESVRAQFEAYGANAYTLAQGTIYWMLNSAWPSLHWNLYDYYFKPGGSYFGAKKALEPVHILWDYNTNDVKIFNSTLTDASNLTASVGVYNIPDLALKYSYQATMDFPANTSTLAFNIPPISGLTTTYFLRLQLKEPSGAAISNNVYWYSSSPDVLGSFNWYRTFVTSYADLSGLNSLPINTSVDASTVRNRSKGTETVTITLNNRDSAHVAFFARTELTAGDGGLEVLPINYTDNYATLWPGEAMTIVAVYATSDLGGQPVHLRIRGYNVPEFSIPVP
jgi:exo-1,4-beta-D-glucosaminidase